MIEQNYSGYLLASHPKRQDPLLRRSVMLILDHGRAGSMGLQINKPFANNVSFSTVMANVGLQADFDQPLYNGGPLSTNKVHVIHSLDWYSPSTIHLTDQIGVSNDLSILTAIADNDGPEYFRVVAGITKWPPGHLEGEVLGEDPWDISHTWSYLPTDNEILFGYDDIDQWHRVIADSGKMQVSSWF